MSVDTASSGPTHESPVVFAEFSVVRVIALLFGIAVIFTYLLAGPFTEDSSRILSYDDRSPLFRCLLLLTLGAALVVTLLLLVRILFVDRRAVYQSHRQLCVAWALGTMRIDLDKISSFSSLKFSGLILVNQIDGKVVYLPAGMTRTESTDLLVKLEMRFSRSPDV